MSELRKNARVSAFGSELNAQEFFIRSIVKRMVSTAIPVRVDAVERAGTSGGALYVDVTPLVCQTDAEGNAIDPVSIPHLPYFRLQHGSAAVICDPKPGDLGLAVFAQQDVSRLTGQSTPTAPGTFRCFDMSDGFYLGGFWGPPPTTFIHIEDSGDVTVTAPQTVTVNTASCTVNAPESRFTGNVRIEGALTVVKQITGTGGLSISGGSGADVDGSLRTTGDVIAGSISLQTHVHREQGDNADTSGPH